MNGNILLLLILIPLFTGLLLFFIKKNSMRGIIASLSAAINLVIILFINGKTIIYKLPLGAFEWQLSLKLYHLNAFIIIISCLVTILIIIYSLKYFEDKPEPLFYSFMLMTLAFANGALLAGSLFAMLFFWEALLATVFGMILASGNEAYKTAVKTFIILGLSDICMIAGIALTGHSAGSLEISEIKLAANNINNVLAFLFLTAGALAKSGAIPFHSWQIDAAEKTNMPFMAFFPALLGKLMGIYFLLRICQDMFSITPGTWMSIFLLITGAVTVIIGSMMALIQNEYKRMIAFIGISQAGYMIMGIGSALPAGFTGAMFHAVNFALFGTCLFLTAGSIERRTGTTRFDQLGGLHSAMPVTFICFTISAAAISGIAPFNGFFSSILINSAVLDHGLDYYVITVAGSLFTAASLVKLGHCVYFGQEHTDVKKAHGTIAVPMVIICIFCIIFGVYNHIPVQAISGISGIDGITKGNQLLIIMSNIILIFAFINQIFGAKIMGSGVKSSDHIRYAPILTKLYDKAETGISDPYNIGKYALNFIANASWKADRAVNWIYDKLAVSAIQLSAENLKKLQNGNYSVYIFFSLTGAFIIILYIIL